MFDGRGMVDEPQEDGSGSERGLYQAYKLALLSEGFTKRLVQTR
jgi:hypothetical protein